MGKEIVEDIEKAVDIANSATQTGGILDNILNRLPSHIADKMLIDEIQNNKELTAPEKAAFLYNFKDLRKSIKNLASTYSQADSILQLQGRTLENSLPNIDDGWFNMYNDIAKNVTKDDMQLIWAKILANECIEPNSISKRLLSILQIIDYKSAEAFSYLCSCTFEVLEPNYIGYAFFTDLSFCPDPETDISLNTEYEYDTTFVNQDVLNELDSLGLINFNYISEKRIKPSSGIISLKYSNNEIKILLDRDGFSDFNFGALSFTSCGKELVNALYNDAEKKSDLLDFFVNYLKNNNYKYNVVKTDI